MKQTIMGICPSKSNCYRIGNHGLFKTKALTEYEKSFYLQCNYYRNQNITGLFEFEIDVFYPANRADLDNALKIVLDCLQGVKAIKNDNTCVKITAQKFVDKLNPRIEFKIKEL
jgi:Holliday junction resolvase RusA-like endonuclease